MPGRSGFHISINKRSQGVSILLTNVNQQKYKSKDFLKKKQLADRVVHTYNIAERGVRYIELLVLKNGSGKHSSIYV